MVSGKYFSYFSTKTYAVGTHYKWKISILLDCKKSILSRAVALYMKCVFNLKKTGIFLAKELLMKYEKQEK